MVISIGNLKTNQITTEKLYFVQNDIVNKTQFLNPAVGKTSRISYTHYKLVLQSKQYDKVKQLIKFKNCETTDLSTN